MAITRNKDGEAWDDETGFVYTETGGVRRPGLPTTQALAKADAAAAIAALEA